MKQVWIGEPITRYCASHKERAPVKGGKYDITHDGMRRRWICADCLANRQKKQA